MRTILTIFQVLVLSTIACIKQDASVNQAASNHSPGPAVGNQNEKLRRQIEQIATTAKGRVGVAAVVLETGESVSLKENDRFPMQSVYKLPIGMAVVQQIDSGVMSLDREVKVGIEDFVNKGQHSPIRDRRPKGAVLTVNELLRLMVSESDGTACDVLLKLIGGPEAVTEFLGLIKVEGVIVANTEKEIGRDWETQYRNWASPAGAVALLRALHERRGLSESSQALLLKYLRETSTGKKRLKSLLPPEAVVAHKTGSSGMSKGVSAATNDIGLVSLPDGRHLAIAVFVSDSVAPEAIREEVIARISRAVWDEFT